MLPMNLMLPSHEQDPTFHPDSMLSPETRAKWYSHWARGQADMAAANWIGKYIYAYEFIQVDNIGYKQMALGPVPMGRMERWRPPTLIPTAISEKIGMRPIHYLVVHDLYLEHGIWLQIYTNRTYSLTVYDSSRLLEDTVPDLVYNNYAQALFYTD